MGAEDFNAIESALKEQGIDSAFEQLFQRLRQRREWHNLFDAKMLQAKKDLSLPLSRPSSLQDVPAEHRKSIEHSYLLAAREVADEFLREGDFSSAWMYLQAIREPEKIAAAIDQLPDSIDDYDRLERILGIALHQGVHPEKGVKLMLNSHGTCSTITALDQLFPQLTPQQRSNCAKLMVRHLYEDLRGTVRRHLEQRLPLLEPDLPLEDLIRGREWIFEGTNYHIDVSHLSSVVRFARSIEVPAEELQLARQLAQYGAQLDRSLQYDGDPPFQNFYLAHRHYFGVLLNQHREAGLKYFREQLQAEPDERDQPILAYVLVDLLVRSEQLHEAIDVATKYLANLGEDVNISLDELCVKAGRPDVLLKLRREQDQLVGFTAALMQCHTSSSAEVVS
ncbi:hypothetical protein [Planctomicrobium sp. SH664]|uniref:hypothetical protein n=1 Tax=Planctomicrobium sp. SH664 TaxID=3448125 RepID=UPI003F5B8D27